MNILKRQLVIACLVLLGACHVGPRLEQFPQLRRPQGAVVKLEIYVDGQRQRNYYTGELVEVREEGVVLSMYPTGVERLVFVSWSDVYQIEVRGLNGSKVTAGTSRYKRGKDVDNIRLLSRYPQGLTAAQLQSLLISYKQEALEPIRD